MKKEEIVKRLNENGIKPLSAKVYYDDIVVVKTKCFSNNKVLYMTACAKNNEEEAEYENLVKAYSMLLSNQYKEEGYSFVTIDEGEKIFLKIANIKKTMEVFQRCKNKELIALHYEDYKEIEKWIKQVEMSKKVKIGFFDLKDNNYYTCFIYLYDYTYGRTFISAGYGETLESRMLDAFEEIVSYYFSFLDKAVVISDSLSGNIFKCGNFLRVQNRIVYDFINENTPNKNNLVYTKDEKDGLLFFKTENKNNFFTPFSFKNYLSIDLENIRKEISMFLKKEEETFSTNPFLNELFKNYVLLKEYEKYKDDYIYKLFDTWKDMKLKQEPEYYINYLLKKEGETWTS